MPDADHSQPRTARLSIRLKPSDHRCLFCLVMGVFGFSLFQIGSVRRETNEVSSPLQYRLDLNSARAEELILLPGIGEVRAASIIRYRTEIGPFQTVDELKRIKGIGPKTLAGLRELVFVHPFDPPTSPPTVSSSFLTNDRERSIAAVPEGRE